MNDRQLFGHVFSLYLVAAGVVFAVVLAMFAFALIHYRAGRGHAPSGKSQHRVAEPVYALCLVGIASFLAVFAVTSNASEQRPLGKTRLSVTITGFQWCWAFHYDNTPVTIESSCIHSDPTLVVPTDENIRFSLVSRDVIHEWWLPAMDYKEEAFPDHHNVFEMRFGKAGDWAGRCSEFCGLYHYRMDFWVKAESPAAFARWLSSESRLASR